MYEYRVKKVIKVVDGDTIDVETDLGFDISITQRVRLAGIDTPESRTRDLAEKELGLEVKELLKHKLEEATSIIIKTEKPDSTGKFGRVIGWLHLDHEEISFNQTLIATGYAWEYDGGTKQKDFGLLKIKRAESSL